MEESFLEQVASAQLARARQRAGIPQQEQAAAQSESAVLLRRAQAARLMQELGATQETPEARLQRIEAEAMARSRGTSAGSPPAQPAPPTAGSIGDYMGADPARQAQIVAARKAVGQADDRDPRVNVITPGAESNILNRLVTQWDKAVAPARDLSRQAKLMETGLAAARRGDLAAGSQAVLVTFQKILDPTSVVRESEYARSAAGQALMSRIQGFSERLQMGGAGVPLAELEKFAQLANEMVHASTSDYTRAVQNRIGRTADHYKIDRNLVFDGHDFGTTVPNDGGSGFEILSVEPAQ